MAGEACDLGQKANKLYVYRLHNGARRQTRKDEVGDESIIQGCISKIDLSNGIEKEDLVSLAQMQNRTRDTSVSSPSINEAQRIKHTNQVWYSKSHIVILLHISLHPKMTAGLFKGRICGQSTHFFYFFPLQSA